MSSVTENIVAEPVWNKFLRDFKAIKGQDQKAVELLQELDKEVTASDFLNYRQKDALFARIHYRISDIAGTGEERVVVSISKYLQERRASK